MIRRVTARNFMAYDDVDILFDKNANIVNIVGDNGSGKSSFLEIVPFAIYGESRVPFDSLIKNDADDLAVSVQIEDVTISRHRKRSEGSSKLTVHQNGSTYRNKEAVDFIGELFGMDYFIFSLTSYFGMGAGDNLITAGTKTRIGYLQRIANISIYMELSKLSAFSHRNQFDKMKVIDGAIKELKFLYSSEYDDLTNQIESGETSLLELSERGEELTKAQSLASTGRDRINYLTIEKKKRERLMVSLRAETDSLKAKLLEANAVLEEMRTQKRLTLKETAKVAKFVKKYSDGLSMVDSKVGQIRAKVDLLAVGVHSYDDEGCPLCGSHVDEVQIDAWNEDLNTLGELLGKLTVFRETLRAGIKMRKTVTHGYNDAKNERDYIDLQIREKEGEIITKKLRLEKITSEIREFYDNTKLDEIEAELSDINNKYVDTKAKVNLNRQKRRKAQELAERIADKTKERNVAGLRMDVASVLMDVFSQKGIPLQLIRDICAEIEIEATLIFHEFEQGDVVVRGLEAEDGKLDVLFQLDTQSGIHNFNQLSAGQRTMMLLSIRLALSKICFRNNPNTHLLDFIVMDEVCSSLSEHKIECLTRVIAKMVQSTFSQVFIISHTPMPNLQPDITLSASMELGDSKLEVI